ncbi:homoserine O-acetyltransferase [Halobacteriales archaeon QH_10_67_13]|nr:MAG: homoserine O-acetyltransferase [Halobacteriales archaeon QH_10_67_13]
MRRVLPLLLVIDYCRYIIATHDRAAGIRRRGRRARDNAVLVCHALTGSQHVASGGESAGQASAWWDEIVGPGRPIDTTEQYVVCVNVPGSCYGTTGPASTDPRTGEPYGTAFPPVTVGDWVEAQRLLLEELGVSRLRAAVGGSVGGMNVLEWAKRYPERVDRIAPIATAPRLDPQCLALDAIARRAITADSDWQGGAYYGDTHPDDGLARARQIGHVMYLSKESMERKFGRRIAGGARPVGDEASAAFPYREVESYLDYQAETFVDRFDANAYLYLIRAMDEYDLAAGCDSDAAALAEFDGAALVLSFTGDWHFTVEQAEGLVDSMTTAEIDATHRVIDSDHGHDAFLVEPESVGPPLAAFLAPGPGESEASGCAAPALCPD